ncbi:thiamine phosphate synthase [Microbacterium sp. JZ70]|uniref:Thiamine-phosphate synthase n=1 Tax=Microbacterium barkeri TaxID=33917 RepID=A0A9W6H3K6_9MICO|nr:thiamine phosphate synthase [Microbacterium barkeri]MDI6943978.1 thiamine phosphate synthase [Microbacterium barkeri]MDR6876355.1 thiamine-phosphate diphosphorylase [Microbacterium barkeri]GLJ61981.1 thiamine-phosphate synthase [Microbacterium barkeri]
MTARPLDLSLYLVADAATITGRSLVDVVAQAVDGGASTVQIRGKDLSAADLLALVEAAAAHTRGRATLLVNDRVDVYLAARAAGAAVDGVHIGQTDLPADRVRGLVGDDAIIGLSASLPRQLEALRRLPAGTVDYLGVGAVRATPTKKDHPTPIGWTGFAAFAELAHEFPCVAIGGVGPGDARDARRAGAAGIAVVRAICSAEFPAAAAAALRFEWADAEVVA